MHLPSADQRALSGKLVPGHVDNGFREGFSDVSEHGWRPRHRELPCARATRSLSSRCACWSDNECSALRHHVVDPSWCERADRSTSAPSLRPQRRRRCMRAIDHRQLQVGHLLTTSRSTIYGPSSCAITHVDARAEVVSMSESQAHGHTFSPHEVMNRYSRLMMLHNGVSR